MTRNPTRPLSPNTSLDSLRKEAKRWLKAIRAGDAAALGRLNAALDAERARPGLRDVQHALAREYGCSGWIALKEAVADIRARAITRAQAVETVLRHAWDGDNGWRADVGPARRMARLFPDLGTDNLCLAAICGDLEAARGFLSADPDTANRPGGPLDLTPLQYLAYGRLDTPAATGNSVAIAALLLDHGADPNAEINDGWDNPFRVVTGVIGEGEGVKPPHPKAQELADLLLARGADPCDTQALYNTSITGDDPHWMDLLYRHSERAGITDRWRDASGGPVIGGRAMSWLDYLLGNAVANGHRRRVAWLLDHGADPNGANAYSGRAHHEAAQMAGDAEMAEMLERAGARPVTLDRPQAFMAAVMTLDRPAVEQALAEAPWLLTHAHALVQAVGRPEAVRMLLEQGFDPNAAAQGGSTPLHWAAHGDFVESARLLVEAGARIDVCDTQYNATPLGWAVFLTKPAVADYLTPLSCDMFALTSGARLDRLRVLLAEAPDLANAERAAKPGAVTPLLCLPDDEDAAMEAAALLLAAGADPARGRREGMTAEPYARKRGLIDAADLIADAG